jgi:hypothetical protein
MVRRYRKLTFGLGALALVAALTPRLPAGGVNDLYSQDSRAPIAARLDHGDEIVTLEWVFRAGDLMSCRTSARDLRHARLAYGDRVQIRAVAVGSDVEYVQSFLRGERLQAEVVTFSEGDYQKPEFRADAFCRPRSGRSHGGAVCCGESSTSGPTKYEHVESLLGQPIRCCALDQRV